MGITHTLDKFRGKQLQKSSLNKDSRHLYIKNRPAIRCTIKDYLLLTSDSPTLPCRRPRGKVYF